jgi:hypothetical protein
MSIQIGINEILNNLRLINRDFNTVSTQMATGKKINAPKDDPVGWARTRKSRAEFSFLTSIADSLNSVAVSIRVADSSMDAIGKTIEEMKNTLETITKNFPPFPSGSEERARLLKMYSELRRQIDQLTIPSDAGAKKIMADPGVSGSGDWTIAVGPNGMVRTIRKEEVHTGPTGLNISGLSETASDEEIQNALASLTAAKDTLSTKQRDLQLDSSAVAKAQGYNTNIARAHITYAEEAESADMEEAAARAQSLELRQALSNEGLKLLNDATARILQLLA